MVVQTAYDNTEVMEENLTIRNAQPESGQYKGNFCRVGSIHMGDIVRLKNIGYNLLSPDPDEVKRALLYIQSNEKHLLTVNGKPFAKNKAQWV